MPDNNEPDEIEVTELIQRIENVEKENLENKEKIAELKLNLDALVEKLGE